MIFVDIFGIIGNIGFAVACLPTAYKTFKAGKSIGTPIDLAWNIWVSCLFFYTYLFFSYPTDYLAWIGGIIEVSSYSIVLFYHYFKRKII